MQNVFLKNLIVINFILAFGFTSFSATPSNYDEPLEMSQEDWIAWRGSDELKELFLDNDQENEVDDNKLSDADSSSDRGVIESLKNIFLDMQHEEELPLNIDLASAPMLLRSSSNQKLKNVVVFHGRFNNYDADLIIPYADYSKLTIINDYIVNVGNSSATGRILYDGDLLNPSEYDSYIYIMNPVYGSTSNVYNYGSFNYRRHYYLNTNSGYNRITYDDMYGNFYVDDIDVYYSASERQYYILMVILLFMGVCFLWFRRH